MCLLIIKKPEGVIKEKHLEQAWDSNPDGVGYVFPDKKQKMVLKKFIYFESFIKSYQKDISNNPDANVLLHFRWATHGEDGHRNIHPFKVSKGLFFGHNGVISKVKDSKVYSDTQVFNQDILQKLDDDFIENPIVMELIRNYIGVSNKLAFLNKANKFWIVNEKQGSWDNNVWYSNTHWKYIAKAYSGNEYYGAGYSWGKYPVNIEKAYAKNLKECKTTQKRTHNCEWCGKTSNLLKYSNVDGKQIRMCMQCESDTNTKTIASFKF